ncbi:MAG: hypothetical protein FWD27_05515 [Coriobacteriia bacterium]|nr:hypothetical protein [Coriobacteriia bacterium]
MTTEQKSDFAQPANALTPEEYIKAIVDVPELTGLQKLHLDEAAIQCECLYRVASLIAYGNGLASRSDINYFAELFLSKSWSGEFFHIEIKVLLPLDMNNARGADVSPLDIPSEYEEECHLIEGTREHLDSSNQVFTLFAQSREEFIDSDSRKLVLLLGHLIANYFSRPSYIGTFEGKPKFRKPQGFEGAWHSLASVTKTQSPGLCPVCGKVVNRIRTGSAGGQPRIACVQSHIEKYSNELKRLAKTSEPEMQFKPARELRARELRWQGNNNARPYQFPGIADMQEAIESTGSGRAIED